MSATETLQDVQKRMAEIAKQGTSLYAQLMAEMSKALVATCAKLPGIEDPEELNATVSSIYQMLDQVRNMRAIATAIGKQSAAKPAVSTPVAPVEAAAPAPTQKVMTLVEFNEYATAQLMKACAETPEKRKPRMAALDEAMKVAKQNFVDTGAGSATIPIFVDPDQQPQEPPKEIDPATAGQVAGSATVSKGADEAPAASVPPPAPAPAKSAPFPWPGDMNTPEAAAEKPEAIGKWGVDSKPAPTT